MPGGISGPTYIVQLEMSAIPGLVRSFRRALLDWGVENKQDFPWRDRLDPFAILVAEFMLHRTQARQVVPVFLAFLDAFPDLATYATSLPSARATILRPLGLEWRARAMGEALLELWHTYGSVPADYSALMRIHGIGQYIAGATVCFSSNIRVALVDSNTVRVTGRVFGLDLSGEARRRRSVIDAIGLVRDPDNPRAFYWAMIDLAHKICRPQKPRCFECPLRRLPCQYALSTAPERESEPKRKQ